MKPRWKKINDSYWINANSIQAIQISKLTITGGPTTWRVEIKMEGGAVSYLNASATEEAARSYADYLMEK